MSEVAPWLAEVVGVRFARREGLAWYRAGPVPATVGSWVVAEQEGAEAVGQVIVGRGQCLSFPGDPSSLPGLVRAARTEEIPPPQRGAGQVLLDRLP